MRRSSAPLVVLVLVLVIATAPSLFAQKKQPKFIPPDISTASDINYPPDSVASGIVVVAVGLNGAGKIKETDTLQDIPSLTAPVLVAINNNWTFKPATLNGQGVDSTIVVSIVFNPFDYRLGGAEAPALGQAVKVLSPDANGFLPPMVIAASWAQVPMNSVAQGAVILDARINSAGRVTHAVLVYRIPSLTTTSIKAAKKWTFKPATFDGKPIAANEVVGYVFRLANISNPVARP